MPHKIVGIKYFFPDRYSDIRVENIGDIEFLPQRRKGQGLPLISTEATDRKQEVLTADFALMAADPKSQQMSRRLVEWTYQELEALALELSTPPTLSAKTPWCFYCLRLLYSTTNLAVGDIVCLEIRSLTLIVTW